MSLYQASVLKQHLKLQNQDALNKAYKKYSTYFLNPTIQENIRSSKEEEYQGIFLTELFVNILGYTLKPNANFNLVAEYKNQNNARKADGAILNNNVAVGVIELKGTNTKDLESIRKQAFDYKANQKGCVYVITSNFEKLRFYINDATEFEAFNLFELSQERFALLYLCLQKDNIINNIPLNIKEASIVEEEQITKQFYKDYSLFKRELYRDLVKRNAKQLKSHAVNASANQGTEAEALEQQKLEKNVKLTLFKKSQKLIDRFLFVFFAEDRGLLPPNSTQQILDKWKADIAFGDERPLYNLFKQYFKFLDQGRAGTSKRAEIYAYNGGLFKEDKLLDSLIIEDTLLYKYTKQLAGYDFESQVDVNILGHIFENSLNEIESVNAQIEGDDFDKQKSKRKKDGVFYTPKYITKYIVENTIGKLCDQKKTELNFKEDEYFKSRKNRNKTTLTNLVAILDTYRNWLLQITICDPACGSGAFLNQALDFLIKEHSYIDELKTKVLGGGLPFSDIENTILENNIYGVDLNEESVEIAKLSLWLRTAQPRRKLNNLNSNIKCGNSLIDSKAVAGNKAFNWQTQFPQVFKEKDKKAYHITTAIHDSRTSARMVKYKVRETRNGGTNPYPNVIYFTPENDLLITQTIANIVQQDNLNLLAFNICADHIHLLLVCNIDEIPAIMQKIKSVTANKVNKTRSTALGGSASKGSISGNTSNSSGGGAGGGVTMEHAPLYIKKQNKPLWQQKYSAPKQITTTQQLYNTVKYIQTNRSKHELPKHSKAVQNTIDAMCCTENKAFKTEYSGGFDVVIGNPPYVQIKNDIFKHYKTNTCSDLYAFFFEKGIGILNNKGYLGYITPSSFFTNIGFKSLREFILNFKLEKVIDLGENVFSDASVDSGITIIKNKLISDKNEILVSSNDFNYRVIKQEIFESLQGKMFNIYIKPTHIKIANKIEIKSIQLEEITNFSRGVEFGFRSENVSDVKNENFIYPIVCGGDISRYSISYKNKYVNYDSENLNIYKPLEIYEKEKILVRRIGSNIISCYDESGFFNVCDVYNIQLKENVDVDLKYVALLLNSSLMNFYFDTKFKSVKKLFPKIPIQYLKLLPIIKLSLNEQESYILLANSILKSKSMMDRLSSKFQNYLKQKFQLKKLSKKLQNWHELDFGNFIQELNKAIKTNNKLRVKAGLEAVVTLNKKDEFEWLDLFEDNKQKAQALQRQINQTDKDIDAMVYELYGLTQDEIAIVENS